MDPIHTTAIDFLERLEAIAAPAVITKNIHSDAEENFRADSKVPGRWLDGYWKGKPTRVSPGAGFGIHFVERDRRVWIGEYQGALEGDRGRYSLILDAVQYFEVTNLDEAGEAQTKLRAILKQNGAVTYSYYQPEEFGVEARSTVNQDLADIEVRYADRPTQRQALVDARLGQGRYRNCLLALWGSRCAVTGIGLLNVIIASHAMPWRDANDEQRLDPCNGLPLIATLDKLFDAGLIAFDPATGDMRVSPALSDNERKLMGVPAPLRKKPTMPQALYLRHHLENRFQGKALIEASCRVSGPNLFRDLIAGHA